MYEELLKELIKEKGGTREQYLKLLDYIAFHETGGTMDPSTIQKSDNKSGIGPGRGKYQFEGSDGSNRLLTAANRTANYYKELGKPIPEEIKRIQSGEIYDATQLHPEIQDTLVLGDLRMKGGLDLKDYVEGRLKPEDLWVDHWWAGDRSQRSQMKQKFLKNVERFDKEFQPEPQPQTSGSLKDIIPNLANFKFGGHLNQFPDGGGLNKRNTDERYQAGQVQDNTRVNQRQAVTYEQDKAQREFFQQQLLAEQQRRQTDIKPVKNVKQNEKSIKAAKKTTESQLTGERPLIYLANPLKIAGDALEFVNPGGRNFSLPTSEEDRQRIMWNRYNPNQSSNDRFKNHLNEGLTYVPEATINTAVGAVFANPNIGSVLNNAINPLAGTGGLVNNLGNKYLPNAHKLNPYAFKPNPEAYYRGVGKEGIKDALKTGVIKSRDVDLFPSPYFARPNEFETALYYNPNGLIEAKGIDVSKVKNIEPNQLTFRNQDAGAVPLNSKFVDEVYLGNDTPGYKPAMLESIPVSNPNIRLLQKDWLKGYKEVPKPKSNFKSEIDWAKWNKEIPENKALMREYEAIEKASKADGTWMKNPDGSDFVGSKPTQKDIIDNPMMSNDMTPEEAVKAQFIQQRSQNHKDAFGKNQVMNPDGSHVIYTHGSPKRFSEFDESMFGLGDPGYSGKGIYTFPNKEGSSSYELSAQGWHTGEMNPTSYKLYGKTHNPIRTQDLKEGQDLMDFNRSNPQGVPISSKHDAAIRTQRGGIRIAPDHLSYETVFPKSTSVKSALGNNGMFDMTNPNIYKGLVPPAAIIGAAATSESKSNTNKHRLGGNLTNTNPMNDINMFNEGGLHEQNPLGGIPQGMGDNGQMNTVEEGEGRMGDMIYSDRIPLPEEVVTAVGLPRKFAGKTPAQALAEIDKIFKDRNDKAAQETKADFAEKIAQAQELVKAQQEEIDQSMAANAGEVPDMMGGQIPPGMEEFAQPEQMMGELPMEQDSRLQTGMQEQPQMFRRGGKMNRYFEGGPIFDAMLGAGTTALNFGNQIFGKSGIDTSGRTNYQERFKPGAEIASSVLSGASAGAQLGSVVPGLGTAVGAGVGTLVGGVSGLIGGNKKKKDLEKAERNNALFQNNQFTSDFKYGGKINKYLLGGDTNDPRNKSYYSDEVLFPERPKVKSLNAGIVAQKTPPVTIKLPNKDALKKIIPNHSTPNRNGQNPNSIFNTENLNKAGRIGNALLRGAPVGVNLAQLRKAGKYDKVSPMLNQTRFQPKYMDERAAQNLADSEMNNQIRGISQLGGSQGAVRSSMLGAGLNRAKTLGASMAQAQAQNNQTDMYSQQFNNQITEANLARRIGAEDRTAMNKGQAATNKSRLLAQIGQDLGNIGKENVYKEIAKITGYTWMGDFIQRNPNASKEDALKAAKKFIEQEEGSTPQASQEGTRAYGGKLKLKRY